MNERKSKDSVNKQTHNKTNKHSSQGTDSPRTAMTPLALALLTVDLIVLAVVWTNVGRVQHDPELSPYYRRYVVEAADAAQVGALLPAVGSLPTRRVFATVLTLAPTID